MIMTPVQTFMTAMKIQKQLCRGVLQKALY